MNKILPVLTVIITIFIVWYIAAIWLNSSWAYDKAMREGKQLSSIELIADTWSQDKPKLPAPHQVVLEIWETTARYRVCCGSYCLKKPKRICEG